MIIVDDMIASGKTVLEVAKELKKRNAARVIICATFGLFNDGLEELDQAYKERYLIIFTQQTFATALPL